MTFPPPDLHRFLIESIPLRFGNIAPDEFGAFISYLFRLDGYEMLPVVSSADLGFHMQGKKEDGTLVILPVSTEPQVKLEVEYVHKAIQARELYKTDQVWVITNASFSTEAKGLADMSDVELWDWNALYQGICELFFEGRNHLDFVMPVSTPVRVEDAEPELKLKAKWTPLEGLDNSWFNLQLTISNPTEKNIFIHLELPAYIDSHKTQILADRWGEDDFVSGLLYAGAAVKTNAQFKVSRLGERPPGGFVVLSYHERREVPMTFHIKTKLKGEACYIVTYCFSRDSEEYARMIALRDTQLNTTIAGMAMVKFYYLISPQIICVADASMWLKKPFVFLSKMVIRLILALSKAGHSATDSAESIEESV